MNRNIATKISNFLLGNGFYIALTLCVGLIGLSGYYLMSSVTPETTPASSQTQLEIPTAQDSPQQSATTANPGISMPKDKEITDDTEILGELGSDFVSDVESEVESKVEDKVNTESDSSNSSESTTEESILDSVLEDVTEDSFFQFILPVDGELLQGHSIEVLAYHETFGDWRVHTGIDIATEENAPVVAIANGHVSAVFSDDMMGTTIVVVHGEDFESTYSNLSTETLVEIGDSVELGQQIATVGNTALSEQGSPTHLHLSITEDGVEVDPMNYLPSFD